MSPPSYPAYKESGVPWLGPVPEHWEVAPIKRQFRLVNGSTPSSDKSEYWDGEITWVTPEDLSKRQSRYITESRRTITRAGFDSCGTSIVPVGSIVLATRAPIGNPAIAGIDLCTNQGCKCLVPTRQLVSEFYHYLLSIAEPLLQSLGRGSTFVELGNPDLGSFRVTVPPKDEQQAIAAFLDRETAQIDALIARLEQLVALLQEKRQALISHAVTKGLDPSAPMKDSGVEWLGEIPAHWEVERNKWLFREVDERSESGDEELLSVSHITGVTPRSEKTVYMFMAESLEGYKVCQSGDLIINTMWAYMGALGTSPLPGVVSPSYNVYRPADGHRVDAKYLDYLYRTPRHVVEVKRNSRGVWESRLRLYPDEFFDMVTPAPPKVEQEQIVRYLDEQGAQTVETQNKSLQEIDTLRERRAALITAAVTGQIDVREVQ